MLLSIFHKLVITLILALLATSNAKAGVGNFHSVLILHSYHASMSWVKNIDRALNDVLKPAENKLIVHIEYMDTKRHYNESYIESLRIFFKAKYKNKKFDLIISSDNNAFEFLRQYQKDLFPEASVVFCGVNNFSSEMISHLPNFTGVPEAFSATETLHTMLKLHPEAKRVFVVNDHTPTGQAWSADMKKEFLMTGLDKKVIIEYAPALSLSNLSSKIRELEPDTLLLLGVYFKDTDGQYLTYEEIGKIISNSSKVPVYSLLQFNMNNNVIGGKVIGGYFQGKAAAQLGLRILKGEQPQNIKLASSASTNSYVFNENGLEYWNIKKSDLPPNSLFINKSPTILEEYPKLSWSVIILFTLMLLLGFILAWRNRIEKHVSTTLFQRLQVQTKQLQESEERYRSLFEGSKTPELIIDPEDGQIVDANQAAAEFYGWSRKEMELMSIDQINIASKKEIKTEIEKARREQRSHFFFRHRLKTGEIRDVEVHSGPIKLQGKNLLYSIVHDITKRREAEGKLEKLATTDELTGAINRRHFLYLSEVEISRAKRNNMPVAFAMLDIDHFKKVNDSFGHACGDEALKQTVKNILSLLRSHDIFARFGGEEFCLCLPETEQEGALMMVERIRHKIHKMKILWEGIEISFTISIGVSMWSESDTSIDNAINRADKALYQAKKGGRNKIVLWQETMGNEQD